MANRGEARTAWKRLTARGPRQEASQDWYVVFLPIALARPSQVIPIKLRQLQMRTKSMVPGRREYMAGFYQPQHFFAAKCVFTDFEAMITATIWILLSKVSLLFFIWGFETSGFFGTVFFDAIFMAPGPSKVVGSLKKSQNRRFCFAIFSVKNASTEKTEYTMTKSTEKRRR